MRRIALACLIAAATASAQGVLGDVLQVGAAVRVWSASHQLAGRAGWIVGAEGNSLHLRYEQDADGAAGTLEVPKLDVDSIHVLRQGDWFRASFADPVLRRVGVRTAVDSAFAGIAPHTPIRIWSIKDSVSDLRGTFEGIARDSIVVLYRTGPVSVTRAFVVHSLDRVRVPGSGIRVEAGAKGGFAFGALAALGYVLLESKCVDEKDGCGFAGLPRHAFAKALLGGAAGLVAGIGAAEASHFVWRNVELP
jgi:hypothetical protein